jgi:hypothetical protein
VPICECGYVKLFEPEVNSPGNSQHLADWYTPSHIIHGFLFYGLGWLILRGKPLSARLSLAVLIEAAWEIAENSPLVIDRYRTTTMALGYSASSIRAWTRCSWRWGSWRPRACRSGRPF